MARNAILSVAVSFLLVNLVRGDYPWGGSGWSGHGNPPWWNNGDSDDDGSDGSSSSSGSGSIDPTTAGVAAFGSRTSFNNYTTTLIAHAVLASLVWVIFMPTGALLLRIGIKNPMVLKLHATLQILSFFIFIAAAGLGVYLARQIDDFTDVWSNIHPRLGLAILAIAFFQPFFGYFHHRIFKRRAAAANAGQPTKPPGRTVLGRIHLWVGRMLIVLGMINGGLGIRLASNSPFQSDSSTHKASIAYGAVAGGMFVLYAALVIMFEIRRRRAQKGATNVPRTKEALPTYEESESSISPQSTGEAQRPRTVQPQTEAPARYS